MNQPTVADLRRSLAAFPTDLDHLPWIGFRPNHSLTLGEIRRAVEGLPDELLTSSVDFSRVER